jgi:hypothetical protein
MTFFNPIPVSRILALAVIVQASIGISIVARHESVHFRESATVEAGGIANIHLTYAVPLSGDFSLHYGDCSSPLTSLKEDHHHSIGKTAVGEHPLARRHLEWKDGRPEKFVWLVPENMVDGGCLFAYLDEGIVGRSGRINVVKRRTRRGVTLGDIADAEGPWFDGVEYLKQKDPDAVFVAQAKTKTIGILGGGMSGLMSSVNYLMIS